MKTNRKTMYSLGYLGLVPFIASVVSYAAKLNLGEIDGEYLFVTYSVVILTFLSGSLWGNGIYQASGTKKARLALIVSNVVALVSWSMLLMIDSHDILIIIGLAIGYLFVWFTERSNRSRFANQLDEYDVMRFRLTLIVVFLHIIMVILLIQGT